MEAGSVSIVILTKNAGKPFERTMAAIQGQAIGRKFEVIAVDSGSTDETLNILERYRVNLHRIPAEEFNFGLTRNYAFSLAKGDFLVTISQDVVPCDESWLENLVAPFVGRDDVVAVQGNLRIPRETEVFYWERIGKFYFTSESTRWVEQHKCGMSFVNCAIRREFWERNQIGFVLHSEDKVFQKRIVDAGRTVLFAKEAACFHGHDYTLKSLVRRLVNEGVGWQYVGVRYRLSDCLHDLYEKKYLVRNSIEALARREVKTVQEFLFPILRPVCIYYGNNKKI